MDKNEHTAKVTGTKTVKLNKNQTLSLYKDKEQELNKVASKIKEVEALLNEIIRAKSTLDEIKNSKPSDSVLINIGAGILIDCNIANKKEAKITLPGNILIDKELDIIIKDIQNRENELNKLRTEFLQNYNQTIKVLNTFSYALNTLAKQEAKSKSTVEETDIN